MELTGSEQGPLYIDSPENSLTCIFGTIHVISDPAIGTGTTQINPEPKKKKNLIQKCPIFFNQIKKNSICFPNVVERKLSVAETVNSQVKLLQNYTLLHD